MNINFIDFNCTRYPKRAKNSSFFPSEGFTIVQGTSGWSKTIAVCPSKEGTVGTLVEQNTIGFYDLIPRIIILFHSPY